MKSSQEIAEKAVVHQETIKLVAMNCQVSNAVVIPLVLLVYLDSNQMRHHIRKAIVMVSFDPDNLQASLGIRELLDIAEETPVFFLEAAEIQIAKDVAQENEAAKGHRLERLQGSLSTAYPRPQVQIGENHRVETRRHHAS